MTTRSYSIVIPTYNEENDIESTLYHLTMLQWDNFEAIIVDDSNDSTPDIVKRFMVADDRIKLIQSNSRSGGRCEARNRGIIKAKGEVVIILNADVRLNSNFIELIDKHYEVGAECVLVRSSVSNYNDLFARYVECCGLRDYYNVDGVNMDWTEGFSCLRIKALQAGLFPSGYEIPLCAGEDAAFGEKLTTVIKKRVTDLNIICSHVAPSRLHEYWNIRKGRGQGTPLLKVYYYKQKYCTVLVTANIRFAFNVLQVITVLPGLFRAFSAVRFSRFGWVDLPGFYWSWLIEQLAFSTGEYASLVRIAKKNMARRVRSHIADANQNHDILR